MKRAIPHSDMELTSGNTARIRAEIDGVYDHHMRLVAFRSGRSACGFSCGCHLIMSDTTMSLNNGAFHRFVAFVQQLKSACGRCACAIAAAGCRGASCGMARQECNPDGKQGQSIDQKAVAHRHFEPLRTYVGRGASNATIDYWPFPDTLKQCSRTPDGGHQSTVAFMAHQRVSIMVLEPVRQRSIVPGSLRRLQTAGNTLGSGGNGGSRPVEVRCDGIA